MKQQIHLLRLMRLKRRVQQSLQSVTLSAVVLQENRIVVCFLHAGLEIGVASTKAFTSQITALFLLTLFMAQIKDQKGILGKDMVSKLREVPGQVKKVLDKEDQIAEIARLYKDNENFLYLGRGYNYPVALEGALKLKEISYIHAEGYPAAEMKHGPIALVDKDMPVVFIATKDKVL